MDIDYDWMVETNAIADEAEQDHTILQLMSNEQLSFLVYWNWGYSGTGIAEVTQAATKILVARGVDYNTLGEQIEEVVSQYY